ncbi:condensin complex subunit SMC2 [Lyophyllum atratum]|nr:condensin complex subunit SMC2 [Lyophyllum atratum]
MRIEELVLEGFKSYPVRTQITGWDSSFNAITGLNGSGKSNILDAICFVLGITNMAQMRAANQQDLIYKRGQAGITKASVTIVFDNSDKSKSPVGQEAYKQITVTRQVALPNVSKYLLNGHKALQANIQTLFQSVQLNINNPNFVIMQGRITKVLNMRPQEILGMVEEAAGTRMFEERKERAIKTMAKKDKRVQEILSLLREEITPKLEKLRTEKRSFIAYQKSCSELEKIGRVLRAWEWSDAQDKVVRKEQEIEDKKAEIEAVNKKKKKALKEIEAAEKDVADVTKKRDAEMSKGGKMKKLEDEVQELDKATVKIKTQAEIQEGTIKDEEANITTLNDELQELQASLTEKKAQLDKLNASYGTINEQHKAAQTKLSTAEELLQTLLTGLSSNKANNSGGGYMGQLAEAKGRVAQGQAEEEQSKVKLGMSEKELKTLEARWKEVEKDARNGEKEMERKKAAVEDCRIKMNKCGWNQEMEQAGDEKLRAAKAEVRALSDQHDRVKQGLGKLNFDYTSPSPNFDRRKVKGLAASLISLEEKHYDKSTALEIAAGGKLYQVVVDDERVGSDLLKNGNLKKRVTLIPLNKISAYKLSPKQLDAAQRLAPGKVHQALSLVSYEHEVANAIAYVFSDNLICEDAESAKQVTFSRDVGVRSVTLAGDVYDPSGTLSGGSAPSGSGVLIQVQELMAIWGKLSAARKRLEALEKEEERVRKVRDEWRKLATDLEMKEHEAKLMEQQVQGSNAARIGTDVEELKEKIENLKLAVQAAKDKQKEAKEECKKLERDMAEFKNNKEGKTEELKADIQKQKAALQRHAVTVKTQQKEVQTAALELEQIEKDIETATNTLDEAKAGVVKLHRKLERLKEQVVECEAAHAKAARKLQEELATLTRFDSELKELASVIKEKKQVVSQADLDTKSLEHAVQALNKEKAAASNFVANLEKQYEWIVEDKDQFGKAGTQYDFRGQDIGTMKEKAKGLEESQKGMKKKVNPKVMNMIDNVEKRELDLQKMLATVQKDKEKIEETIDELDRYKRDALQKTWEKVDGDFGGIFAELLPGNFAKLQPPDGQDLMDGLEVKVQLGSVWKQSLTELSGEETNQLTWYIPPHLKVAHCSVPNHGTPPVQACAHVYPRRDRRSAGSFAHAAYRAVVPDAVQRVAVYRCVAEGGAVHECQCFVPGSVPGRDVYCGEDGAEIGLDIVCEWRWRWREWRRAEYKAEEGGWWIIGRCCLFSCFSAIRCSNNCANPVFLLP